MQCQERLWSSRLVSCREIRALRAAVGVRSSGGLGLVPRGLRPRAFHLGTLRDHLRRGVPGPLGGGQSGGEFATLRDGWRTRCPAVSPCSPSDCVACGGRVRHFATPTAARNCPPRHPDRRLSRALPRAAPAATRRNAVPAGGARPATPPGSSATPCAGCRPRPPRASPAPLALAADRQAVPGGSRAGPDPDAALVPRGGDAARRDETVRLARSAEGTRWSVSWRAVPVEFFVASSCPTLELSENPPPFPFSSFAFPSPSL